MHTETLYDEIAEKIVVFIKDHDLSGGQKIPSIRQFKSIFGVSETTIISAIKILAEKGILHAVHGKGVFVQSFSPENILYCAPKYFDYLKFFALKYNRDHPNRQVRIDALSRAYRDDGIIFCQHGFLNEDIAGSLSDIEGMIDVLKNIYPNLIQYRDNGTVTHFPLFFDVFLPAAANNFLVENEEERFVSYSGLEDFRQFIDRVSRKTEQEGCVPAGSEITKKIIEIFVASGINKDHIDFHSLTAFIANKTALQTMLNVVPIFRTGFWPQKCGILTSIKDMKTFSAGGGISVSSFWNYPGTRNRTPLSIFGVSATRNYLDNHANHEFILQFLTAMTGSFAQEGGYKLLSLFPAVIDNNFVKDIPQETISSIIKSASNPLYLPPEGSFNKFIIDRIAEYIYSVITGIMQREIGIFCIEELISNFQKYRDYRSSWSETI